jgi:hypothetical protein
MFPGPVQETVGGAGFELGTATSSDWDRPVTYTHCTGQDQDYSTLNVYETGRQFWIQKQIYIHKYRIQELLVRKVPVPYWYQYL